MAAITATTSIAVTTGIATVGAPSSGALFAGMTLTWPALNSIASVVIGNGGSGYNGSVTHTFTAVPLTGGAGSGAQATIVCTTGVVTSVTITTAGTGYHDGDALSAANTNLGGSGSGLSITAILVGEPAATPTVLGSQLTGSAGQAGTYNTNFVAGLSSVTVTFTALEAPVGQMQASPEFYRDFTRVRAVAYIDSLGAACSSSADPDRIHHPNELLDMTDIDKAVADTSTFEGYKSAPYKDTRGMWTVGEGTCLEESPISAKDWKYLLDNKFITVTISGAGARWLLRGKIVADLVALQFRFPDFASLPDLVQTLLLEMSYQLGDLREFTTFDTLVTQHRFADAAVDARGTNWYKETPDRAEIILKQLENVI